MPTLPLPILSRGKGDNFRASWLAPVGTELMTQDLRNFENIGESRMPGSKLIPSYFTRKVRV